MVADWRSTPLVSSRRGTLVSSWGGFGSTCSLVADRDDGELRAEDPLESGKSDSHRLQGHRLLRAARLGLLATVGVGVWLLWAQGSWSHDIKPLLRAEDTALTRKDGLVERREQPLTLDNLVARRLDDLVHIRRDNLASMSAAAHAWYYNRALGQIVNQASGGCLDSDTPEWEGSPLRLKACDAMRWSQRWEVDGLGGLVRNWHHLCLDVVALGEQPLEEKHRGAQLRLWFCNATDDLQQWDIEEVSVGDDNGTLAPAVHWRSGLCLQPGNLRNSDARVVNCTTMEDQEEAWTYNVVSGQLHDRNGLCLAGMPAGAAAIDVDAAGEVRRSEVQVVKCQHPPPVAQRWLHDLAGGALQSFASSDMRGGGGCLIPGRPYNHTAGDEVDEYSLMITTCQAADVNQIWELAGQQWTFSRLFCFVSVSSDDEELEILRSQRERGVGVFACDTFAVVGYTEADLGRKLARANISSRTLNHSELTSRDRVPNRTKDSGVWSAIMLDARFAGHDWYVRIDLDVVFFPARLRWHLRAHDPTTASYVKSPHCGMDASGALEILSRDAVDAYINGADSCHRTFNRLASTSEGRGLEACLALQQVRSIELEDLLSDTTLASRSPWSPCPVTPCWTPSVVAFRSFISAEEQMRCFDLAVKCRVNGDLISCT